jgi:hypothetical protein
MRSKQASMLALLVAIGSACGQGGAGDATELAEPSSSTMSLPCAEIEQTRVMLDIPGPGQPTPEEAVAPFAGALTLVAQPRDGQAVVLGLRANGTVFRVYRVAKHKDGWWPDSYRECSG